MAKSVLFVIFLGVTLFVQAQLPNAQMAE